MLVSDTALFVMQLALIATCTLGLAFLFLRGVFTQSSFLHRQYHREEAPLVLLFENGVLIDANRDATV